MSGMGINEIAEENRRTNALRITTVLIVLGVVAMPLAAFLRSKPPVIILVASNTVGQALAYWIIRSRAGQTGVVAGMLLSLVCQAIEYLGAVKIEGNLGTMPYLSPLLVLLAAATLESRWLWPTLLASILTLAGEGLLSPWQLLDQAAIFTSAILALITFVVSLLHVRGTERAFALASSRDAALALSAEQARRSEERYRLIADNTDDLISLIAPTGEALYLSPSYSRLFGETVESLDGNFPLQGLGEDDRKELAEGFARALREGQHQAEFTISVPSGGRVVLDSNMRRVEGATGPLVATISRNVSERKLLEQRLQVAERLEVLGQLAGSVAHDFNNLLTVIGGAADLALQTVDVHSPACEDLRAVMVATSSATKLTRQLLTFSRRQLVVPTRLDLARALEEQREILLRMVGKNIDLDFDFAAGISQVDMPSSHIEQLAMNLAVNARDAMPHGGRLRFTLRERTLANDEVVPLSAGRYVELAVADQGTGIPESLIPRLFDPFFTTKGERGTGLGLATCHSIVSQLKGNIAVETALGKGTTFRILLPASSDVVVPSAPIVPAVSGKRVLVVDDELAVREMTARMLRMAGYEVRTAANIAEATQVLEAHDVELEVVLTDVVLSGESGTDLIAVARTLRPRARIVVMSGYTPNPEAARMLVAHGAEFLPKPFVTQQLLHAIRPMATS